jgi:hypothetical protein
VADIADIAELAESSERELLIQTVRLASKSNLPPIGRCYNCDEYTEAGARFCCIECRDDYDRIENRRSQSPGAKG